MEHKIADITFLKKGLFPLKKRKKEETPNSGGGRHSFGLQPTELPQLGTATILAENTDFLFLKEHIVSKWSTSLSSMLRWFQNEPPPRTIGLLYVDTIAPLRELISIVIVYDKRYPKAIFANYVVPNQKVALLSPDFLVCGADEMASFYCEGVVLPDTNNHYFLSWDDGSVPSLERLTRSTSEQMSWTESV